MESERFRIQMARLWARTHAPIILFAATSLLTMQAGAQWRHAPEGGTSGITGVLRADLLLVNVSGGADSSEAGQSESMLSPMRAALYSAVIPGAGQWYAGSYWKAAAFAAVEAAAVFLTIRFYAMGDERENAFKKFADGGEPGIAGWSAVRYAQWMEHEYGSLVPASVRGHDPVTNPAAANPWDGVRWDYLNEWEQAIASLTNPFPNNFTHLLPRRPDQQYYELIGKYPQYTGGWDDAWNGGTPLYTYTDIINSAASPHFLHYRDMRGEANGFYANGTGWSYVIVANHVLSALEAAWNASRLNHRIKLESRIMPVDRGGGLVEFVPTAVLQLEL